MYQYKNINQGVIKYNKCQVGERLEEKIQRITSNKEPIKDGAPLIYTERKNGVMPEYNVKTDRFEVAVIDMDAVAKSNLEKREERHKPPKTDGGDETIQETGTDGNGQ